MIEIKYLHDYPNLTNKVARWIYDEFIIKVKNDLLYEDFYSFFKNSNKSEFPVRLIAMFDNKCVGTISVVDNDLTGSLYTPWLGGVFVDKNYRNNGIGQGLLKYGIRVAKNLEYENVYLVTHTASHYYARLGWQKIETCLDEFGQIVDVFKHKTNNQGE